MRHPLTIMDCMIAAVVAALILAAAAIAWAVVVQRRAHVVDPDALYEMVAASVADTVSSTVAHTVAGVVTTVAGQADQRSAQLLQVTAARLEAIGREQLAGQTERADAVLAGRQQQVELSLEARERQIDQSLAARQMQFEQRLGEVQSGVRSDIDRLTQLVQQLGEATSERFGQVDSSLRTHAEIAQTLAGTTNSLREALASSNARGQWGERLADDVLRAAGFREGINYRKRTALAGDAAGIPDFTFMMPRGQVLFMDVKFPMAAYLRYLEAGSDAERSAHRATFLRDVRARVRELAKRQYAATDDRQAVSTVLMFVPNETVSGFILENDHDLLDEAMRDQVVICSPMTLFAFLGVIRQAFDNYALEQTSQEILGLLGKFGQQWGKYAEQVDKVRKQFDTVARSFDELATTRRRQLERPLRAIEDLRLRHQLPVDGQLFATEQLDDSSDIELPSNVRELGA